METIILLAILVACFFATVLVTRNDWEGNRFSKKGFYKLALMIGISFVIVCIYGYFAFF